MQHIEVDREACVLRLIEIMASYAQLLDLPVELLEMVASNINQNEIGQLRLVHPQFNCYLARVFCKRWFFNINLHEATSNPFMKLANGPLGPHLRALALSNFHVARFFNYRILKQDEESHIHRYQGYRALNSKAKRETERAIMPGYSAIADFAYSLSLCTNLEEIVSTRDYATVEFLAKDEGRPTISHDTVKPPSTWYDSHSCDILCRRCPTWELDHTAKTFICKCGQCYGRSVPQRGRRGLSFAVGTLLASVPRYQPGARFPHLFKLSLLFPASSLGYSSLTWVDLADFILQCPNLRVLQLWIDSTEHDTTEAPISTFIRVMASHIHERPLRHLQELCLTDNPCRSSPRLVMNDLLHLLNHVHGTLQKLILRFGQLSSTKADVDNLLKHVTSMPMLRSWRIFLDYPELLQQKSYDERNQYEAYIQEYEVERMLSYDDLPGAPFPAERQSDDEAVGGEQENLGEEGDGSENREDNSVGAEGSGEVRGNRGGSDNEDAGYDEDSVGDWEDRIGPRHPLMTSESTRLRLGRSF